jgi:hypothetical protein
MIRELAKIAPKKQRRREKSTRVFISKNLSFKIMDSL